MLPESLLCLLNAAFVLAQTRQSLPLNQITPFTPTTLPNPSLFSIPSANTLSVSVALCAANASPRFFITNSSRIDDPGPGGGQDVFEIQINNGHGNWTGIFKDGGTLSVVDGGQASFELAVSDDGTFSTSPLNSYSRGVIDMTQWKKVQYMNCYEVCLS